MRHVPGPWLPYSGAAQTWLPPSLLLCAPITFSVVFYLFPKDEPQNKPGREQILRCFFTSYKTGCFEQVTKGSFRACVEVVGPAVEMPQGLCSEVACI